MITNFRNTSMVTRSSIPLQYFQKPQTKNNQNQDRTAHNTQIHNYSYFNLKNSSIYLIIEKR